jgi:hypothetical protein
LLWHVTLDAEGPQLDIRRIYSPWCAARGVKSEPVDRQEMMEKYNRDLDSTMPPRFGDRKCSRLLRRSLVATFLCLVIYLFFHRSHSVSEYIHDLENAGKRPSPSGSNIRDGSSELPVSLGLDQNRLEEASTIAESNRVPLEAHIMSKCPDAKDCLQQLIVPAMEQINDKVDFRLSFIGR